MRYQSVFKRYELKYLITKEQQIRLKALMKNHMEPDAFGKSTITNIYFDTPDKLLIRRSLEKPIYKEKLRVRSYGVATKESKVFVELKKKFQGIVYKRRIDMSELEAREYLYNGTPPQKQSQITREIDYFCSLYGQLVPSVYLSYEREAYFSKTDKNFRVTFDENILCRDYDLSLQEGIYGEAILPEGMVLMEVKTAMGIPLWLTQALSKEKIYKTSFSKYGTAYKNILLPRFLGGRHVA